MRKMLKLKLFCLLLLVCIIHAQDGIDSVSESKMVLNPQVFGGHVEFLIGVFSYEYGGQIDFDLFSSRNNFSNIGVRLSAEKYGGGTVGGSTTGSPFTNYNLFARHSLRGDLIWLDVVGGITYYKSSSPQYIPNETMLRAGFELSLHFINNFLGVVLKTSTSFRENTGYFGIGFTMGFYRI